MDVCSPCRISTDEGGDDRSGKPTALRCRRKRAAFGHRDIGWFPWSLPKLPGKRTAEGQNHELIGLEFEEEEKKLSWWTEAIGRIVCENARQDRAPAPTLGRPPSDSQGKKWPGAV